VPLDGHDARLPGVLQERLLHGIDHPKIAGVLARARLEGGGQAHQPLHVVVAILLCLLVPGSGWLLGDPELAWSMYAKSASFRLRVETTARGQRRSVPASALAAAATGSLRTALGGAESFKFASGGPALRRHLAELTLLACQVSGAERVRLTLDERATLDAPVQSTRKEATCPMFVGLVGRAPQSAH
jgi:hypothetical protein